MRRTFYASAVALLLALSMVALATPLTTHNCTLNGSQQSRSAGQLNLTLDSTGDITGTFTLTIQYDAAGVINTGRWELNAGQNNESGAATPTGTLTGQVTAGTLTLNQHDSAVSLSGVQLSVTEGAGSFQGSSGSGQLSLTSSDQSINALTGTVSLNF